MLDDNELTFISPINDVYEKEMMYEKEVAPS